MERIINIHAQGALEEFKDDGDDLDRIYLPVRGVQAAMRTVGRNQTESALVVLPGTTEVEEFTAHTKTILRDIGQEIPETLLIPSSEYFLGKAIEANIDLLRSRLNPKNKNILWPYANTSIDDNWINELRNMGYNIQNALPRKDYLNHQTRSGWGRKISQPDQPSFPERWGLPYPISYISNGENQLIEAYKIVAEKSQNNSVYLKLAASAGGFGLAKVTAEDEARSFYELVRNSGSLYLFGDKHRELDIEVQEEIQNIVGFGSIQYSGGELETPGGISYQILNGSNWVGNKFNVSNNFLNRKARQVFGNYAHGMTEEHLEDFYSWGGLDVAIVAKDNEQDLVILENNWGRITGAHPGIYFARTLGTENKPFMVRKLKPPNVNALECWNMLKTEGMAFDAQKKRGAVPIPWVRNVDAFIFVAGESDYEISNMSDRIMNLTAKNGYH